MAEDFDLNTHLNLRKPTLDDRSVQNARPGDAERGFSFSKHLHYEVQPPADFALRPPALDLRTLQNYPIQPQSAAKILKEYRPRLGVISTLRVWDSYLSTKKRGSELKSRFEQVAKQVDLAPGLLAASALAEDDSSVVKWLATKGESYAPAVGADDYVERQPRIKRLIPLAREFDVVVPKDLFTDYTNEENRHIPYGKYPAKYNIEVHAAYLKERELRVREWFAKQGGDFDKAPVEIQYFFTRLAVNPGKISVESRIKDYLNGNDPFKRTGTENRLRKDPVRSTTIVTARAIHLAQEIFGDDLSNKK